MENLETIEKILYLQALDSEIDVAIKYARKNNLCTNVDSVKINKELNLPLTSKVGILLALGKSIDI